MPEAKPSERPDWIRAAVDEIELLGCTTPYLESQSEDIAVVIARFAAADRAELERLRTENQSLHGGLRILFSALAEAQQWHETLIGEKRMAEINEHEEALQEMSNRFKAARIICGAPY